jgi:hypothetical protein
MNLVQAHFDTVRLPFPPVVVQRLCRARYCSRRTRSPSWPGKRCRAVERRAGKSLER